MSDLVPPISPAGGAVPATLRVRRCVRHMTREAAARCPDCGGFFCRECVSEFDGRVLCVDCLAKAARSGEAAPRRWAGVRGGLKLAGAIGLAWMSFYAIGRVMLKVPASFQEETGWNADNDTETEP